MPQPCGKVKKKLYGIIIPQENPAEWRDFFETGDMRHEYFAK